MAAFVREESSFFPGARSRAGARGLMQLMPETARTLALRRGLAFGNGDLLDEPAPNLALGAAFLAALLTEFPDPETRHFVKRVMVSLEEYRRIYGAGTAGGGASR